VNIEEQMTEVERLKALMLKASFFVMQRQIVAPEKLQAVLLAHYHWIIALEKQGKVLASGPLTPEGCGRGVGMTVFKCASFEEARELASGDPFITTGAADFSLAQWQINEGRLTLTIDFSDGTATVA
jgi:uncharacterized protein